MLPASNRGMCPGCGMLGLPGVLELLMPAPVRLTLAGAVEAHVRGGNGTAYEVDAGALVERLRGLSAVQLLAVIDVAERMNAAVLRDDVGGRERGRREVGVGG